MVDFEGTATGDKEDRFSGRVAGKALPMEDPEASRPTQVPVPASGVEETAPGCRSRYPCSRFC